MANERDSQPTPLIPAHQRFVEAYLIEPNAVRAYRAAYPGTSYCSAATRSGRLLKRVDTRAEIAAARRARQRRTRVTADKVIRELARVAFSDVLDLFDAAGQLRAPHRIPLSSRRALASVKVSRERVTRRTTRAGRTTTTVTVHESVLEYRFASKLDALGRLFDHLGLTTSIPPLDVLFSLLPPALADQLRQAMAGTAPRAN